MGDFVIRGIMIGLIFGIPLGAMGAMTVQRTLNYGVKAGLLTGLGSSAADCFYAGIGIFGLTFISDFLLKYQGMVHLAGGCLILWMGIRLICSNKSEINNTPDLTGRMKMFLSSFAVGITNPASVLTFLFAFSWFGISGQSGLTEGIGLVCGVFIGTYVWWGMLSASVIFLKKKTGNHRLRYMNQAFGTILMLFGTVIFIRTFL